MAIACTSRLARLLRINRNKGYLGYVDCPETLDISGCDSLSVCEQYSEYSSLCIPTQRLFRDRKYSRWHGECTYR
jgi:hypothetical protein